MDGNRRYATKQGWAKTAGHRAGLDNLHEIVHHLNAKKVETISVYALSTENWNRSALEVQVLEGLIRTLLFKEKDGLLGYDRAIRFVGDLSCFEKDIQGAMNEMEQETASKTNTIFICLSYGGRLEMVHAARALAKSGAEYSEENLYKHMWSHDMPDIDLLIRTGGDQRLSNYLPWQASYAELCFTDTLWPELSLDEIDKIMEGYLDRVRINKGK